MSISWRSRAIQSKRHTWSSVTKGHVIYQKSSSRYKHTEGSKELISPLEKNAIITTLWDQLHPICIATKCISDSGYWPGVNDTSASGMHSRPGRGLPRVNPELVLELEDFLSLVFPASDADSASFTRSFQNYYVNKQPKRDSFKI